MVGDSAREISLIVETCDGDDREGVIWVRRSRSLDFVPDVQDGMSEQQTTSIPSNVGSGVGSPVSALVQLKAVEGVSDTPVLDERKLSAEGSCDVEAFGRRGSNPRTECRKRNF